MMCIDDRLAAYLFDSAVVTFGTIVENAAQEMIKLGPKNEPRWENKYKLSQLLDDKFRFPPDEKDMPPDPHALKGAHGIMFDEVS